MREELYEAIKIVLDAGLEIGAGGRANIFKDGFGTYIIQEDGGGCHDYSEEHINGAIESFINSNLNNNIES